MLLSAFVSKMQSSVLALHRSAPFEDNESDALVNPKKIVDLWAKLKMFDGNFHEDGQEDRFMHLPAGSCSGSNETTVTLDGFCL